MVYVVKETEMKSKCCDAEAVIVEFGMYDPDDDGNMREWREVECQQCGGVYFADEN